ncbi:MAG: ABC transporter substrate-binding protein [Acidobacteria bacterium]|nr:ABC transporter substrate-binding protein [Acidobacteriota bacterium]
MRVVSLLASGTEIVCALGAGDALVGRSHECDNPEWVRTLPVCTQPAFDVTRSSREIDADVKRRLRAGEPLYHVDGDLIDRLTPDLLIAQIHCDVCAVTPADVRRSGCSAPATQVVSLSAGRLADIYDGIRSVAHALGREQAGDVLVAGMQRRISAVSESVRGRPRPTVVMVEWTEPVFTSGNWGPELIEAAGGAPLLGEPGVHSTAVAWERVLEADPDYIVVAPCGFGLERTLQEIPTLERLPHWFELRAVKGGRVALADGNRYFNRSGTTIVETVEILAEILHGDRVRRHWRGRAWNDNPFSAD